jgi:hypothetical protein
MYIFEIYSAPTPKLDQEKSSFWGVCNCVAERARGGVRYPLAFAEQSGKN